MSLNKSISDLLVEKTLLRLVADEDGKHIQQRAETLAESNFFFIFTFVLHYRSLLADSLKNCRIRQ